MIRKRERFGARNLSLMTALLALGGCAGEPTRLGTGTTSVTADQALVMPPVGHFAVSGITQKRFTNALQQEIYLSTNSAVPGQNVVQVRFFGTRNPMIYGGNRLSFAPITEARIDSEMRGTLPGVAMARSPYAVQNDFGAFGYAFGRPSSGELCMYAWQQLRTAEGEHPPVGGYGAIQIRVRLCETGATEKQLLAFMYGFTINGSVDDPGWNPYGSPAPVRDRLGMSGDPIYPAAEPAYPGQPTMPAFQTGSIPARAEPATRRHPEPPPASSGAAIPIRPALPPGMERVVVPSPIQTAPATSAALPSVNAISAKGSPASTETPANAGTIVPSPACIGTGSDRPGYCP